MDHALRIARTVGIWAFGLFASGAAGSMVGTAFQHGYDDGSMTGAFGGLCAFACFRLWMGEHNAENSKLDANP